jgi:hypothetical protein
MYRLTEGRGECDNFRRFAVFPIRNADFVEIKQQFGCTALYVIVQKSELFTREILSVLASAAFLARLFVFRCPHPNADERRNLSILE